jgi:hypothetical protein
MSLQNASAATIDQEPDEEDDDDDDDDDDDREPQAPTSMGWKCLDQYQGEYVIHVGELFSDANLSIDQAPWGRSSSPEFQQRLACEYQYVSSRRNYPIGCMY